MKHIKTINEIFGIGNRLKGLFKDGESTAKGILDSMTDDMSIEGLQEIGYYFTYPSWYNFVIDDFSIKVKYLATDDHKYAPNILFANLYIDDVEIDVTTYIIRKIFKKCQDILQKQENKKTEDEDRKKREDEYWIKKDAKIHFRKR